MLLFYHSCCYIVLQYLHETKKINITYLVSLVGMTQTYHAVNVLVEPIQCKAKHHVPQLIESDSGKYLNCFDLCKHVTRVKSFELTLSRMFINISILESYLLHI